MSPLLVLLLLREFRLEIRKVEKISAFKLELRDLLFLLIGATEAPEVHQHNVLDQLQCEEMPSFLPVHRRPQL